MPRKRRSTHVRESIDFATLRSKFEKPKIAPDPTSGARSFPSQPIYIPTAHPGIPLWYTNVSPITTGTSIPINLARNGRSRKRSDESFLLLPEASHSLRSESLTLRYVSPDTPPKADTDP